VTKMALKDALLPLEIVAPTTLPQSGFVQQPITLPSARCASVEDCTEPVFIGDF